MTVRDYFKNKYAKNAPEYLRGVLATIDKLPPEDEAEDDVLELTEEVQEK